MRMKFSRRTNLVFMNRTVEKDSEGITTEAYGTAFTLTGEVWQAGGQVDAKMYGERANTKLNGRIEGDWTFSLSGSVECYTIGTNTLSVGDGFSADGTNVTHRITSIKATKPLQIVMDKI